MFLPTFVISCLTTNMLKRKGDGTNSESPAKKGGPQTAAEEKTDPIPRHLPENTITLNFTRRSWEEIAPGFLYYLPLCQTLKYMMDDAMQDQFNKFKNTWETMEIHAPHARISNLIMLQDDLRVQNNTPTDATAFTQVVYLLKYCPRGQKQYFKLAHVPDPVGNLDKTTTLTYDLNPYSNVPKEVQKDQLVVIKGFESFDKLAILGAKANKEAGFVPNGAVDYDQTTFQINDPYIAPNTQSDALQGYSGNMYPADGKTNFLSPGECLTMAINQDHISFYKYGDTIDIPITTNLEGKHLLNVDNNDFTVDKTVIIKPPNSSQNIVYATEWAYPSRNRPYLKRSNYYDPNTYPVEHGKNFKSLNHCFLAMPPIRKPGGELLGQRCSCLLEQHFSITLHMSQAVFLDQDDDGTAQNNNSQQIHQDDQIVLRRNIYGKGTIMPQPPEENFFCPPKQDNLCPPKGYDPKLLKDETRMCFANNWDGFLQFCQRSQPWSQKTTLTFSSMDKKPDNINITVDKDQQCINLGFTQPVDPTEDLFKQAWIDVLHGYYSEPRKGDGFLRVWYDLPGGDPSDPSTNIYLRNVAKKDEPSQIVWFSDKSLKYNMVTFNVLACLTIYRAVTGAKCVAPSAPQKADPVVTKEAIVFFT